MMIALPPTQGLAAKAPVISLRNRPLNPSPSQRERHIHNWFRAIPSAAMAEDQMLQVILFALLFGLALSKAGASGENCAPFLQTSMTSLCV